MDRAYSSGASGTPPSAPGSPSTGYPTSGNPGTGTPATKPGAWWYYMVTEELRKLIVDAGLTPDYTNTSQISQAVQAMIAAGAANDYKASVRAATVGANITLAGGAPSTLDGVTLVANDRILVKDQTTGSQNGIYVVTTLGTGANGTWTRATDADQAGELTSGAIVAVEEGTTNADSQWMLTTDGTITIGTTTLTFIRKDAGAATGLPSGAVAHFAMNSAPTGWLKANGAAVSRTTYAALFAAIGTTFGVGDGSTTFNLPDLRGEFIRGWDDARGVDSGRVLGSAQSDLFKSHTHVIVSLQSSGSYQTSNTNGATVTWSQGATEATGGAETRPRNIALLACIKI